MQVMEIEYNRHVIKAGTLGSGPAANVFQKVGKKLTRVHSVRAKTEEGAIAEAKAWVDAHLRANSDERPVEDIGATGTVADFELALQSVALSNLQKGMLEAHLNAPDMTLSATELAKAGGHSDYSTANLHYGMLGRKIAEAANLPIPRSTISGNDLPTGVIARFIEGETGEHLWIWQLRENFATALRNVGVF